MIKITIPGQPVAQQRPRFSKANFKIYDPNWKEKRELRNTIRSKAPRTPFKGSVYLNINFYTKRPLEHFISRKRENKLKPGIPLWKVSRPDIDNFIKYYMDALDDFITDDAQICKLTATKKYSVNPKTIIEIGELEHDTKKRVKTT